MLVSEILRIKGNALFTTPPNGTVLEAVKVMAQHDIGSLVVMDHGQMAGMLTFAEVLEALAARHGGRQLAERLRGLLAAVRVGHRRPHADQPYGHLLVLYPRVQRVAIDDGGLIRVFDDIGIDRTDIQMDRRV